MIHILTYEQLNENEHATTRQMGAFNLALKAELEYYKDELEKVTDGDKAVRLQLMQRIYQDFLAGLERVTGNALDVFRQEYGRYEHRIKGLDQPNKYPGAFLRISDIDPVNLTVNLKRHP